MSFKMASWSSSVCFSSFLSFSAFFLRGLDRRLIKRTMRKMTKAMIRKSTVFWMKLPTFKVTLPFQLGIVRNMSEKSTPPMKIPMIGIKMSETRELIIFWKAPPIMTPTARSISLSPA